jgi:hypothetical protein
VGGESVEPKGLAVDIDEGMLPGNGWSATAVPASEFIERQKANRAETRYGDKQEALQRNQERILKAMDQFPEGETKSKIRTTAGINGNLFPAAFGELLADGKIEPCSIKKNGRSEDAFRRSGHGQDNGQDKCIVPGAVGQDWTLPL